MPWIDPDPLPGVPDVGKSDWDKTSVMTPAATARDRRWQRHAGRGSFVGVWLTIGSLLAAGASEQWAVFLLIGTAALVWWGSGLLGALLRSELMDPRMAVVVEQGLTGWRSLPPDVRKLARPVADELVAAGARHDKAGVRARLDLIERAVQECAARPYPGHRIDVEDLAAWLDAAQEVHRD